MERKTRIYSYRLQNGRGPTQIISQRLNTVGERRQKMSSRMRLEGVAGMSAWGDDWGVGGGWGGVRDRDRKTDRETERESAGLAWRRGCI